MIKSLVIFISFLCFLWYFLYVSADDNLNFSYVEKVYKPTEEIEVVFDPGELNCFPYIRIRPEVNIGQVEIFNSKTLKWVSNARPWEEFPNLEKTMKVRVISIMDKKVSLYFETQNIKNGTLAKSDKIDLWISDEYSGYVDALNSDIFNYVNSTNSAESIAVVRPVEASSSSSSVNFSMHSPFYFLSGLVAIVIGFMAVMMVKYNGGKRGNF